MGLFKKDKKPELPKLPELPQLPKLPSAPDSDFGDGSKLHELPSFPTNNFGEKFSRNTIKNAISGEDDDEEDQNVPAFPEKREMIKTPFPPAQKELMSNEDIEKLIPKRVVKEEPVFVQIDKFEEGMNVFKKIKRNMEEIEVLLKETKDLKQKEEEELSMWETEIQEMKNQIENIDRDIFSKI